ncbi:unnamed protein product [Spodoptera littoralis]|uniref:Uncharacterized protein n=1 Tax=Spodoptera littoralis TaxID=7109 RepID=A0A9P0I8W6_SPOLI|nr:unnamed protein product [Spodoptera littoralis]CAH1643209.1 unnamed protein product [Spodoptera littoralis]
MNPKDVDKKLSEFEIAISQAFIRFEVRGKKGRKVPVILYPKLIEAYDILLLYRYHVGIPKENDYFFALPPLSHFRGSDVMRTFAISSGAKHPENLTSTKLRKNVATMSQILNLTNNELDQLATFMGHDIRVHREYYRLPESTVQLAKISKILIASEKEKLHNFKGKNLDEININTNKISDDDESTNSETETNVLDLPAQTFQEDMHEDHSDCNEEHPENNKTSSKKKSRKKKVTTATTSKKKIWTAEEKNVVEEYFERAIIRQKVPGKSDCEECLEKNAQTLKDRDWKGIKYYVSNIIQRNRKK